MSFWAKKAQHDIEFPVGFPRLKQSNICAQETHHPYTMDVLAPGQFGRRDSERSLWLPFKHTQRGYRWKNFHTPRRKRKSAQITLQARSWFQLVSSFLRLTQLVKPAVPNPKIETGQNWAVLRKLSFQRVKEHRNH